MTHDTDTLTTRCPGTLSRASLEQLALPVVFVFCAVGLQRHWADPLRWYFLVCFLITTLIWTGSLAAKKWATPWASTLPDAVIFMTLVVGLATSGESSSGKHGALSQLMFWSPLISAWWGGRHHTAIMPLAWRMATLFAGLLLGQITSFEVLFEYLLLGLLLARFSAIALGSNGLLPAASSSAQHYPAANPSLTGLTTAAQFEDELALTAAVSDRYRIPFSLMVCEIEGLAAYTKINGVDAANTLVKIFSWKVADQLRIADTLSHWDEDQGGSKFVILLPNTSVNGSQRLLRRIRYAIADIRLADGQTALIRIGLSQHQYGDDPMSTFASAEAAMMADAAHPLPTCQHPA